MAFEIDHVDDTQAVSVVLHGRARKLEEDEAHRADSLPLRSWVPTLKYDVVEIEPTSLTGRRLALDRPWLHMSPS